MSQIITLSDRQNASNSPIPGLRRRQKVGNRSRKVESVFPGLIRGPNDSITSNGGLELRVSACANAKSNFSTLHCTLGRLVDLLSTHDVRPSKDGLAFIFAELGEYRTDADVLSVYALAYEVDGKLSLSEVRRRVQESGFEAVVWTTHSHLRTRQSLGLASYKKWHQKTYGIDGEPTDQGVKLYCSTHRSYKHLSNVRLADRGKTSKVRRYGKVVVEFDIEHDPEHKTRIVFPLARPVSLGTEGLKISEFKAIYHAHGTRILGDAYSTESQNPARLHYLPSHPPGLSGETIVFNGELVDPDPIWTDVKAATPAIEKQKSPPPHRSTQTPSTGLDELEHILRQIPPDLEYPDWFKCIAAIFHETSGSDAGAELAHSWSGGDPRYSFKEVERIWDSLEFDHPQPARIGTLIKIARSYNDAFRPYRPVRAVLDFILHRKDQ